MNHNLDQVAPELAQAFRKADRMSQQKAVLAACAASRIDLPDVGTATASLFLDSSNPYLRHKLEALSKEYDDVYFEDPYFNEDGSDAKISSAAALNFRKSRLVAALSLALSSNCDYLEEALYEALFASDPPSHAIRASEKALGVTAPTQ